MDRPEQQITRYNLEGSVPLPNLSFAFSPFFFPPSHFVISILSLLVPPASFPALCPFPTFPPFLGESMAAVESGESIHTGLCHTVF